MILFGVSHSGIFSLFKKDEDIKAEFEEAGLDVPIFDFITHPQHQDKETHCIVTDNPEAENFVLFLHGSPGSGSNCIEFLKDERLKDNAQIATMDRPGYGYSDYGDAEPSLAKQVEYIKVVIDKYAGDKNVILAGHSLGGPLVAKAAMELDGMIDGLVMIAASNDPELEPEEWFRPILNWWGVRWLIPVPFRVSNEEILPLKGELENMLPDWNNIRIPVTVIQGDKDNLVPEGNAYFTERMLEHNPEVNIDIIKGGDHFILWSEHNRITTSILDMINVINTKH